MKVQSQGMDLKNMSNSSIKEARRHYHQITHVVQ